jgi:hypothetical protein
VSSTDTGSSMLDRSAVLMLASIRMILTTPAFGRRYVLRDREFSQIVSNHLRLDFDLVEFLSRVDANNATNHLRNHNHVSQMRLDEVGLLIGFGLLLRLTELLDQTHGLALETSVEPTAGACVDDITELV